MSFIKLHGDLDEGPAGAFQLTGKKVGVKGQAHVFAELDPDSDPIQVELSSVKTVQNIFNVTAVLAATEYSQALPANTKEFTVRSRSNAVLNFTLTAGNSGTIFTEIPVGASYTQTGLSLTGATVYFQSNVPGVIVEIEAWT